MNVSIKGQMRDSENKSPKTRVYTKLIGKANETTISFCGKRTKALIDSGSQVTTVSEAFLKTLPVEPELESLEDLNLTVTGPDGSSIPYLGLIVAHVEVDFIKGKEIVVPALVMPDTDYNADVPVLLGTNVIEDYQNLADNNAAEQEEIPSVWQNAFVSLHNGFAGLVKSTSKTNILIQPMEVVPISGMIRKQRDVETVVTEQTDKASSKIGVCPRIINLDKPGRNARVPVKIFNMSAKVLSIPPRAILCELQEVKVLRSWEPQVVNTEKVYAKQQTVATESLQKAEHVDHKTKIEEEKNCFNVKDIGVDLSESNITKEQREKAKVVFEKWQNIFSRGPTDLGHTDLVRHEIHLTDETPFKEPFRKVKR